MVNILLANGFEEVEALTPCDMLRRAEIEVNLVSTEEDIYVTGNHGICVKCDKMLSEIADSEMVILPGGLGGVASISASPEALDIIRYAWENDKYTAAICACHRLLRCEYSQTR